MKTNTQSWFLVKDNWMTDLSEMSNEEFGLLIRSLYSETKPSGQLGYLVSSMQDEFDRVNAKSKEAKSIREERSKKAAQARWNNAQVMLKHAQGILEDTTSNDITMLKHNEAMLSDAGTETETITNTNTKIVNNNIVYSDIVKCIDKGVTSYKELTKLFPRLNLDYELGKSIQEYLNTNKLKIHETS
jgi:predicted transcriptional regulator